jgi:hypothetical protein
MTARCHRPDVDVRVESMVLHAHAITEQRTAGERRGRVDGQHPDALVGRAQRGHEGARGRRLAYAGRTRQADDGRVPAERQECRHRLPQQR